MGELFKDMLSSEESLFLNPQFLDFDYQPKLVPFRESHQKYIATCIKPLLQRRNGKNLIVFGKTGVGKTVSLKHVLQELKDEYSDEIYCLYVNCWKKDTSFKVISDVCEQLNYKWIHNKNFDDLIKAAAEIINKKSVVVVLDEVDKLQDQNVIYSMLEDLYRKCLILITNENNFVAKLDNRIKSRLIPDLLEFKSYNKNETYEILKQRAQYSFIPNILDEKLFSQIVDKTHEIGDIRVGLFLLKQAVEDAESKSSRKITEDNIKNAMNSLNITDLENDNDLDFLVSIIKQNSGKYKSEIFKIYEEKGGKSYRTFQRRINELESDNKIKTREEVDGSANKQTIIEFLE